MYICKNPLTAFHFYGGYSSVRQVKLLAKLTSNSLSLFGKDTRLSSLAAAAPGLGPLASWRALKLVLTVLLVQSLALSWVWERVGGSVSIFPSRVRTRAWHREAAGPRRGFSGGQLHCPVFELGVLGPQHPCTECRYVDGFKGELWKLLAFERVLPAL